MHLRLDRVCFLLICLSLVFQSSQAQQVSNKEITNRIAEYKTLIRGPYLKIEWFCDDGTHRDSKDPCPEEIGGIQHARYRKGIEQLQEKNHLYFADILAYTDRSDFWDTNHNHSRMKQYQLNRYLMNVDDGWLMRKAQFYRGAIQNEDEEDWGVDFYNWLLASNDRIEANYFLIRQSLKDIPHEGDEESAQDIRALSRTIADEYPKFMNLRVKIHNRPEQGDIQLVEKFKEKHEDDLPEALQQDMTKLIKDMKTFFAPVDLDSFSTKAKVLPTKSYLRERIQEFSETAYDSLPKSELVEDSANLMCEIRTQLTTVPGTKAKLKMLDLSNKLEEVIFKNSEKWEPKTLLEQLDKIYALSLASASAGFVEWWEWNQVDAKLQLDDLQKMTLAQLQKKLKLARSQVEWGSSMVKAIYGDVIEKYSQFEPKANGFLDDRVRSSVALRLGENVSELGDLITKESVQANHVMDLSGQSSFYGLNPGYATGELVVVKHNPDQVKVSPDKIYVFQRPPADLKPVAGIATVSEGNLVSHVQLLARNLAIPNAVLSQKNLDDLEEYNGKKVFYAVSDQGNVILKLADDMSSEEKKLFDKEERNQEKIKIPIGKIDLTQTEPLDLTAVNAASSGKLYGPKAANFGQLKSMFPDHVVNGVVIPFGVFREHMNQEMPLQEGSYWDYLIETFAQSEEMRQHKIPKDEVRQCELDRLMLLHEAIENMPLKPKFVQELQSGFKRNFGKDIGEIPVFLRSDTNMEDLENFTGAGLNLTLFNVLNRKKILEGIKEVWASPYTQRSSKWRQQYLSNPENVFPSILVIPSVDVDYSGVMITKGMPNNNPEDLTVAFSRGAGGAVDGQAAESWLIHIDKGSELISPAREPFYNRLPKNGGLTQKSTTFNEPILSEKNKESIRSFAKDIRKTLPEETTASNTGPYDVELGFLNDKLWLFQIRPFVENDKALSSAYLKSISPKVDEQKVISLQTKI